MSHRLVNLLPTYKWIWWLSTTMPGSPQVQVVFKPSLHFSAPQCRSYRGDQLSCSYAGWCGQTIVQHVPGLLWIWHSHRHLQKPMPLDMGLVSCLHCCPQAGFMCRHSRDEGVGNPKEKRFQSWARHNSTSQICAFSCRSSSACFEHAQMSRCACTPSRVSFQSIHLQVALRSALTHLCIFAKIPACPAHACAEQVQMPSPSFSSPPAPNNIKSANGLMPALSACI